jgi:hypothetical protein
MVFRNWKRVYVLALLWQATGENMKQPEAAAQEHKELFGYEIWGHFYRTKEELLEAFVDKGIQWATPNGPFNGMNEEWVKANIREVYVHGVTALAKREAA